MWYAKARYYDSDLGRFVAEDPLKGNIADIQSQNLYPYVRNNPLKYVDLNNVPYRTTRHNFTNETLSTFDAQVIEEITLMFPLIL